MPPTPAAGTAGGLGGVLERALDGEEGADRPSPLPAHALPIQQIPAHRKPDLQGWRETSSCRHCSYYWEPCSAHSDYLASEWCLQKLYTLLSASIAPVSRGGCSDWRMSATVGFITACLIARNPIESGYTVT